MNCHCGRPLVPKHCPSCGSTNSYAKSANNEFIATDPVTVAPGFRCRRCGVNWNTSMECQAPRIITAAEREVTEKEEKAQLVQAKVAKAGGVSNYLEGLFKDKDTEKPNE